jgi:hypothetical protein
MFNLDYSFFPEDAARASNFWFKDSRIFPYKTGKLKKKNNILLNDCFEELTSPPDPTTGSACQPDLPFPFDFLQIAVSFFFVVPLCGLFHTVVEDPWPKLIPHPHKAEENYPIRCPVNVRIILKQRTGNWLHDFNEFNVGLNVS